MKSMKALVGALNTDEALVGTFPNPDLLSTVLYSPKFVFQLALKQLFLIYFYQKVILHKLN